MGQKKREVVKKFDVAEMRSALKTHYKGTEWPGVKTSGVKSGRLPAGSTENAPKSVVLRPVPAGLICPTCGSGDLISVSEMGVGIDAGLWCRGCKSQLQGPPVTLGGSAPTVSREAYDGVLSQLSDLLVEVRRWREWGDKHNDRAVHTGSCRSDAPFFSPDCGSLGCAVEKARKHNEARGLK